MAQVSITSIQVNKEKRRVEMRARNGNVFTMAFDQTLAIVDAIVKADVPLPPSSVVQPKQTMLMPAQGVLGISFIMENNDTYDFAFGAHESLDAEQIREIAETINGALIHLETGKPV